MPFPGIDKDKIKTKSVTTGDTTKKITELEAENGFVVYITTTVEKSTPEEWKEPEVSTSVWISKKSQLDTGDDEGEEKEATTVAQAIKNLKL